MKITLPVVGVWMFATGQVGAFTFHWELDDAPEGSERATLVQPVQVLLSDQLFEIAPHSASLQLMTKYSVHLEGGWSAGHAHSLLRTFESIPQEANDPYAAEPRVPASVWRLTHEHVQDDVSIEVVERAAPGYDCPAGGRPLPTPAGRNRGGSGGGTFPGGCRRRWCGSSRPEARTGRP